MIAVYGLKFILAGAVLTVICALAAAWRDNLILFIIALVMAVLTVFLSYFYRNPVRSIPDDPDLILSVADGKVVAVKEIESDRIGGSGYRVSIFLSVFDVHINRIPCSGSVVAASYKEGAYIPAYKDDASVENEQAELTLETDKGTIIFSQIAGILARRIENDFLKEGLNLPQDVSSGDIYGIIHFGSRADILMPDNVELEVKEGDRVKAGETPIARFR